MGQTFLQTHKSCSMQKTARKSGSLSKNQRNLKMTKNGLDAKAIAHAKYSVWVKKENCLKHAKNVSTNTLKFFYSKKRLEKEANIQKMRAF